VSPRVLIVLVGLCVALLAAPGRAHADEDSDVVRRKFGFAERGKHLAVTVKFTDVFDYALLQELDSGVATTLVLRAYVYKDAKDGEDPLPLAFSVATLRVVYDLWEEVYLVQIDDLRGRQKFVERTQADALKRITELIQFPVAPLSRVPIGDVCFVGLIVEVNPVSEALLAEVRRWLAKGDADRQRLGSDSSFFGSFVSIFVNPKIPVADRVLKLRSQPFYRVKR
jgi:hypothetical protein